MPSGSDQTIGDEHLRETASESAANPHRHLTVTDGVAVLAGVVLGIGIFGFPPLVAEHAGSSAMYMGLWLAGGVIALMGGLCYAELGSAYPDAGGEYHYLQKAWGSRVSLLFAWARGTVIQTGSIAAAAFIYGEYAQALVPLGSHGIALHAGLAVVGLTLLNLAGTGQSKRVQVLFTALTVLALASVTIGGLVGSDSIAQAVGGDASGAANGSLAGALGMGMVFVLLTYGGWNEAAYLSGELRDPKRNISRVMLLGILLVTGLYLLVNWAYLHIFGLAGLRQSQAVGADLMHIVAGPLAAALLSLLVCLAALSTINATIMTGARVYYALGRDLPLLKSLSSWSDSGHTPTRALIVQGAITLGLVAFGATMESGIGAMVAYTAPVFWLFMMLTGLALMVLRQRYPERKLSFRVPFYPLTPLVFVIACAGLLWSSTIYAGTGALVGLAILAAGLPLLLLANR